eukprot:scaffold38633_cov73-Phaeocystis_antarctica.AAC.1
MEGRSATQPTGVLVTRIDSSGLNPATVCGDGAELGRISTTTPVAHAHTHSALPALSKLAWVRFWQGFTNQSDARRTTSATTTYDARSHDQSRRHPRVGGPANRHPGGGNHPNQGPCHPGECRDAGH